MARCAILISSRPRSPAAAPEAEPPVHPPIRPSPELRPTIRHRPRTTRSPTRAPRPRRGRVPPADAHPQALECRAVKPIRTGRPRRGSSRRSATSASRHGHRRRGLHITRYEPLRRGHDGGLPTWRTTSPMRSRHGDPHPGSIPGSGRRRVPTTASSRWHVFRAAKDFSPLTVWLGKDVSGKAIPADLAKMPTCWWPAPPARASRAPSTRCCPRSCCARRPTRCARARRPWAGRLNHYEAIPHLLAGHPARAWPPTLQNLVRMECRWRDERHAPRRAGARIAARAR
jgi:hypothetical protein